MKQLIKLLPGLCVSSAVFALNPVQGFYVGLMGEVSHGPGSNTVTFVEESIATPVTYYTFTGIVNYSGVSGGGGGVLGYKLSHFRLEGEIYYNHTSTGPMQVGTCTVESPNVFTPTGVCTPGVYDDFESKALAYSGSSGVTYGFANLYFDFFNSEQPSNVMPYLGIGLGGARVRNFSDFITTSQDVSIRQTSHGQNDSFLASAVQGIGGVSYYMDDFTWVSMDFRYSTTNNLRRMDNHRYSLSSINFNVNFAFDKGGINLC